MSVTVENLEKNMVKLTIEVPVEKVEAAITKAYNKQKKSISIPGFRKGKVPQKIIEKMYGPEVFYEEASEILISENYPDAMEESGVDIVSRPTVDVVTLEKGQPFVFTAEVAKRPEVKLGNYKGITVTKADTEVTDEEVEKRINEELKRNSRMVTVEDRVIETGDTAVIDYEGFVDDVPFEGGKGVDHPLEIGSGTFIPGFEDQLIGKKTGDETDVTVTFPEDYHAEELAGKEAVFKVTVKEARVREMPELNDEYVQDFSEYDTVEDYRAGIREDLEKDKLDNEKRQQEDEAVKLIVDDSEMEIPDAMLETQVDSMLNDFAQRMQMQGLNMRQYMQFTGQTTDMMREQMKDDALMRIKSSLVLEQIAKNENLLGSDEDVEQKIKEMAEEYRMEIDKLKEMMPDSEREAMKREIGIEKAIDLILENAEKAAPKEDKKAEEA